MHFHYAALPYPQPHVSCNIPLGVIVANVEEAFRMIGECLLHVTNTSSWLYIKYQLDTLIIIYS